jgi:hypothetical protein
MSQNKDIIFKLRELIDLRQRTIMANKKAMKGFLIEYKKALELDKELKLEQKNLSRAINLLQYGFAIEAEKGQSPLNSENNALNRDMSIYTSDEE